MTLRCMLRCQDTEVPLACLISLTMPLRASNALTAWQILDSITQVYSSSENFCELVTPALPH